MLCTADIYMDTAYISLEHDYSVPPVGIEPTSRD